MSLIGKTIVVTRDASQARPFVKLLKEKQADVFLFSTIQLTNPDNVKSIRDTANKVSTYDWLIFTSAIAVRFFLKYVNLENLKDINIACVGKKTDEEFFSLLQGKSPFPHRKK